MWFVTYSPDIDDADEGGQWNSSSIEYQISSDITLKDYALLGAMTESVIVPLMDNNETGIQRRGNCQCRLP